MKQKLTQRLCESVKPDPEKRLVVKDTEVPGLLLKVSPTGKKTFMLYYRTATGEQREPALGSFPQMSVDDARKKARIWRAEVDRGGDPSHEKQEARKNPHLSEFIEEFLSFLEGKRKPATVRAYRWTLLRHALPGLGTRRIAAITRQDISRLHAAISKTGTLVAANKLVAILASLFNYAEQVGARPEFTNPCRRISRNREVSRERFLDGEEFGRLAAALDKAESENPRAVAAIRLLAMTGMRKGEVLSLQWGYIDSENRRINLPDSKTGKKVVHIPKEALAILEKLEALREPSDYVFPGRNGTGCYVALQKPWVQIRDAAGLPGLRLHDLRHSFASIGAGLGMSLPVIGRALGHRDQDSTQRYAHLAPDPVSVAVDLIGKEIAKAMSGTGARIIPTEGAAAQAEEKEKTRTAGG